LYKITQAWYIGKGNASLTGCCSPRM